MGRKKSCVCRKKSCVCRKKSRVVKKSTCGEKVDQRTHCITLWRTYSSNCFERWATSADRAQQVSCIKRYLEEQDNNQHCYICTELPGHWGEPQITGKCYTIESYLTQRVWFIASAQSMGFWFSLSGVTTL